MSIFTSRREEVLKLIVQGLCRKAIGDKLSISRHTVDYHIDVLSKFFKTTNIAIWTHYALAKGLVNNLFK